MQVFDEEAYLKANPDVAAVVASGGMGSGEYHYNTFGKNEGRQAYFKEVSPADQLINNIVDNIDLSKDYKDEPALIDDATQQLYKKGLLDGINEIIDRDWNEFEADYNTNKKRAYEDYNTDIQYMLGKGATGDTVASLLKSGTGGERQRLMDENKRDYEQTVRQAIPQYENSGLAFSGQGAQRDLIGKSLGDFKSDKERQDTQIQTNAQQYVRQVLRTKNRGIADLNTNYDRNVDRFGRRRNTAEYNVDTWLKDYVTGADQQAETDFYNNLPYYSQNIYDELGA